MKPYIFPSENTYLCPRNTVYTQTYKILMVHTIKYISIFLSVILIVILAGLLSIGADGISALVGVNMANYTYENKGTVYEFSFNGRAVYIYITLALLLLINVILYFKTEKVIAQAKQLFICIAYNISESWKVIRDTKLKYIMAIPLIASVCYALSFPITHDEGATYMEYINNTVFGTMACYTLPNNHILYSLLGHLTVKIPGLDLLLAVRLPAIIAALLTWPIAFRFVRKFYSETTALAVVAITSMSSMIFFYSSLARGYSLVTLFVVICLYAAFNIVKCGNQNKHWLLFAMSGIFGFYTMPSFLYPFFTINLFIICSNYKYIGKQIVFNALTGCGVFFLYLPVFMVMGVEALTSNSFVVPISRMTVLERLPGFLIGTMTDLFELPYYIFIPLIVIVGLFILIKRDKETLMLWAIFLVTPVVLIIIQSVIPFFRTFCYYGFIFTFLMVIPFNKYLEKVRMYKLLLVLLVIQVMQGVQIIRIFSFNAVRFASFERLIDHVLEDNKSYGIQCDFLQPDIRFEISRRGFDSKVVQFRADSIDADTINGYDYLIIDKRIDLTKSKIPTDTMNEGFQKQVVNIYKK